MYLPAYHPTISLPNRTQHPSGTSPSDSGRFAKIRPNPDARRHPSFFLPRKPCLCFRSFYGAGRADLPKPCFSSPLLTRTFVDKMWINPYSSHGATPSPPSPPSPTLHSTNLPQPSTHRRLTLTAHRPGIYVGFFVTGTHPLAIPGPLQRHIVLFSPFRSPSLVVFLNPDRKPRPCYRRSLSFPRFAGLGVLGPS